VTSMEPTRQVMYRAVPCMARPSLTALPQLIERLAN
jgi:hypothetical protein